QGARAHGRRGHALRVERDRRVPRGALPETFRHARRPGGAGARADRGARVPSLPRRDLPGRRAPGVLHAAGAARRHGAGRRAGRRTRYIVGDEPSRADFTWLPFVEIAGRAGADVDRARTPWLIDWRETMRARPSYERSYPPHWQK